MKGHEGLPLARAGARRERRRALACALALLLSPPLLQAKDAQPNLGGGLEELAAASGSRAAARRSVSAAPELQVIHPVKLDDAGRALVRITLDGNVSGAAVLQSIGGKPGIEVIASDMTYRAGVIEFTSAASFTFKS